MANLRKVAAVLAAYGQDDLAREVAEMSLQIKSASDGESFAKELAEDWAYVKFDPERGEGEARIGNLGLVKFHESGNDPAVIVQIPAIRLKAPSKTMLKSLNALSRLVGNTG